MRTRPYTACLLALAFQCAGCVFPWTAHKLDRPNPEARVILVRGLAGYWPGALPLSNQLKRCGIDNLVVFGCETREVGCALAQEGGCPGDDSPIVIVGYSLGANDAIKICRGLDDSGIQVASLILIDCPYHDTIPPNVERCLNIYRSRPYTDWIPMFRGLPVDAECGETDLENLNVRWDELECAPWTHNHFTICASGAIHDVVADEIQAAVDGWNDGQACGF